ncbi:helix-turn-helix transcriptional regulator [Coraliomargarita sp. SDUM461004]|uniref:Helix-turn-helix transcriptional regulator n=1 Tax=Thalassobacterium sedimentorum TaxID=3041258 RepID=A0ABU1AFT9_9BACT|nr:helix-turn-helix transcriptional regulator [Coraliomargarita sp. SDUM461004]MDQ8193677.1 helix-turn-helix transcriptional regulator [Coraliomargarita sp. SDUM461004]
MNIVGSNSFPEYRLEQWNSLRIQLLWAYQKQGNLPQVIDRMDYHFQSAALVIKGWAKVGVGTHEEQLAEPGQWLIFRQGRRRQQFSEDCELLSIVYRFQLPTGEALYNEGLPLIFEAAQVPRLEREARKVLRLMARHVDAGFLRSQQVLDMRDYMLTQNALRSFLLELTGILHARGVHPHVMGKGSTQVAQALELINTAEIHELGKSVTNASIAQQVSLSLTHLERLMVAETGRTLFQYIDLRKLRTAQDALLAEHDSMKAIAYSLGFSSPAHFNSWFKKRTQMTPLQFRRQGSLG